MTVLNALSSLPAINHRDRLPMTILANPSVTTPDESPVHLLSSSGAAARKRVEFFPWPNMVDAQSTTPTSQNTALKALPPSRDCQSNGKSILKPQPASMTSSQGEQNDMTAPPPETMEMIARQLANNEKGSSLDAYMTLSQTLKAYDRVPDEPSVRTHVASILRCIKRDLSIQDQTQSSPIDTNLIAQALKVSVIFVWSEHMSPFLTDDFRVFIMDRSITALVEHTAPKIIIIHYMHLLAMQNFRTGIMTSNNRAVRLLEALQDITNHIQGKGAVSERLLIYQKLMDQAKPTMKMKANLWMRELFSALSSSVKDIRDKAISVSARACSAFPSSPTVSAAAREALASIVEDRAGNSRTMSALLTQRLEKMIAAKDEAIQVPQIWALGMLLCSSNDVRLEQWNLLRDWLKTIQRCFNCSDTNVRSQAFPAWNRFICITRPHEASDVIVSMLPKPIITQLERSGSTPTSKGTRPAATSSYCMLLYYAFRPASSHKQYTRIWNEYIVKVMTSQFLSRSTAIADLCCRVIMTLMWKEHSVARIWNENRAHEEKLMDPEELPQVDCKWTRSKAEAIVQIFKVLFKYSVWGPILQHSDQAYIAKAWRNFLRAIRESASKEIKPSVDTRKAMSQVIEFVKSFAVDASVSQYDEYTTRARLVCQIAVAELGSVSVIDILQIDPGLRLPMILSELSKNAVKDTMEVQHDLGGPRRLTTQATLPSALQKCLPILNEELLKFYQMLPINMSQLQDLFDVTSHILRSTPSEADLPCLLSLQQGLSAVLEDSRSIVGSVQSEPTFYMSWEALCLAVIDQIIQVHPRHFQQLDVLLSAMLLSSNTYASNELLNAWGCFTWQAEDASYGIGLQRAIETLSSTRDVWLPGFSLPSRLPKSQVHRIIQTDSAPLPARAVDQDTSPMRFTVSEIGTGTTSKTDSGPSKSASSNLGRSNQENDKIKKRLRHDDSQIQFIPVDSSPANRNEIESQFLTERQKDVRDRQRHEQTVTFPDLRYSPRPRSSRSNRSSSADCGIARKAAAIKDLPSTPTLNRQQDQLDEDELPTPTPKARNKTIQMIDVDIPSSPPSIVGNANTGEIVKELMSSPPQMMAEQEANMVNLEDAVLEQKDTLGKADRNVTAVDATEIDTSDIQADVQWAELDSQVMETVPAVETIEGSTEKEMDREPTLFETAHQDEPHNEFPFDQDDDYNDEIDELSASQLSQTLDWHIAEEAAQKLLSPAGEQPATNIVQKRKIRTGSENADRDGKKRRKRASRDGTSFSSSISDGSDGDQHVDEDTGMDDCITVSMSPSTNPNKRQNAAARTSKHSSRAASPSTSTQKKRRRGRPRKSQVADVASEVALSEPEQELTTRVNVDVLEVPSCSQIETTIRTVPKPQSQNQGSNLIKTGMVPEKSMIQESEGQRVTDETPEDEAVGLRTSIMTALQTALKGLRDLRETPKSDLDLRAIDDLCFQIRYQAQDVVRNNTTLE